MYSNQKNNKKLERQAKAPAKGVDSTVENPKPSTSGTSIKPKHGIQREVSCSSVEISTDDSDTDFECPNFIKPKRPKLIKVASQMGMKLIETSKIADLTAVSSRCRKNYNCCTRRHEHRLGYKPFQCN